MLKFSLPLGGALESLLHVLFPVYCPVCGKLGAAVCADCLVSLRSNRRVRCIECGLECPCEFHEDGAWVYYYARHQDAARRMILSLKYSNHEIMGRVMGERLGHALLEDNGELISSYDRDNAVLVPIPLHRGSGRRFNQAASIALGISGVLGFRVSESLRWSSDIRKQTAKSGDERFALPSDAFRADAKALRGRDVILVDDVMTTGTTLIRAMTACASAGASPAGAITWSAGGRGAGAGSRWSPD